MKKFGLAILAIMIFSSIASAYDPPDSFFKKLDNFWLSAARGCLEISKNYKPIVEGSEKYGADAQEAGAPKKVYSMGWKFKEIEFIFTFENGEKLGKLCYFKTNDPRFNFWGNLKIGASVKEIEKYFGVPLVYFNQFNENPNSYAHYFDDSCIEFSFDNKSGKITEISIGTSMFWCADKVLKFFNLYNY